jgi:hypothetical protein
MLPDAGSFQCWAGIRWVGTRPIYPLAAAMLAAFSRPYRLKLRSAQLVQLVLRSAADLKHIRGQLRIARLLLEQCRQIRRWLDAGNLMFALRDVDPPGTAGLDVLMNWPPCPSMASHSSCDSAPSLLSARRPWA